VVCGLGEILLCDCFRLDPCVAVVMLPETHSRVVASLDKVEGLRFLASRDAQSRVVATSLLQDFKDQGL
jgi:hypothetical protein